MVLYQNLTRKLELLLDPLEPGVGTMYPMNPLSQALRIGEGILWLKSCLSLLLSFQHLKKWKTFIKFLFKVGK